MTKLGTPVYIRTEVHNISYHAFIINNFYSLCVHIKNYNILNNNNKYIFWLTRKVYKEIVIIFVLLPVY